MRQWKHSEHDPVRQKQVSYAPFLAALFMGVPVFDAIKAIVEQNFLRNAYTSQKYIHCSFIALQFS